MKAIAALAALMFCATVGSSRAQRIEFDPRSYQDLVTQPTEVLVLGSPHLQATPEDWDSSSLETLLARLEAYHPAAIMIEALPGESADALWRYRESSPETAATYSGRALIIAQVAQLELDVDAPTAEAEVRRLLLAWPSQPTAAQRRHLAALFAASGDPNSALVQWWRLAPDDMTVGDGISHRLISELDAFASIRNEGHLIGARLAARLGLERVYPIDDHLADDTENEHASELEQYFSQQWIHQILDDSRRAAVRDAPNRLRTSAETLATYRLVNGGGERSETGMLSQYLREMLHREGDNRVGRLHLATLEARNLRQVANIREAASMYPGQRILVIIGFSHKPWFETYLRMSPDVDLIDVASVLE
ncbi:MAG: hypothetical protein KF779_02265 [Hyphomonadaceae bacterium]|nr:hypothetical protein [Hyphomonadaceae bacterium]